MSVTKVYLALFSSGSISYSERDVVSEGWRIYEVCDPCLKGDTIAVRKSDWKSSKEEALAALFDRSADKLKVLVSVIELVRRERPAQP